MLTGLYLKNKIQTQLNWNGEDFTFIHKGEDRYHNELEPTEVNVRGMYHQQTSYVSKHSGEGSVTTSKATPMILCLYDDGKDLSINDTVVINGKAMFITGIEDIHELNVGLHISLEVNE